MSSAEGTTSGQTPAAAAAAALVRVADIEGKGRALVASKALRAGEIVLTDSPILLYSALPLKPSSAQQNYCSNCFRILDLSSPSVVSCPSCSALVLFCTSDCRSAALISSHSPWVCQALSSLGDSLPLHQYHQELHVQARFLVAAYNLAIVSPCDFQILLSLQGQSPSQPDDVLLHSLISSLCFPTTPLLTEFSFSLELTSALLSKDKLNAFGLMEPFTEDDGDRSVRAYGIYPKASFFNHDCLPNACRFDYVDATASSSSVARCNTELVVRVIHDVPQGREVCLSYFPVNLTYSDRQRRLREDYGFTCTCDRCKVEANWSDDEDDHQEEGYKEAMDEEDHDQLMEDLETEVGGVQQQQEEENNFPHAYFFLRYMCNKNNCWGTLAPLPPSPNGTPSNVMECNLCGNLKNDEEPMDGAASEE